jgi:hypothetical protein
MAAQSKPWVYGCSLVGIAGSNPAGDIDVCLVSFVCCQVEVSATGQSLIQISPTECDPAQQNPSSTTTNRQKEVRISKMGVFD